MYDTDTLQRAYLTDEVHRVLLENQNMFALTGSNKPVYGIVPDPEVTLSGVEEFDVNGAIEELAAVRGISAEAVAEQVFVLSGGEDSTEARAEAVLELAAMTPDELDEVGLTAKGKAKKKVKALDEDEDEDDDEDDINVSEHMGYEGPKPKPGKRKSKPVRVARRGQSPFGSEGGAPDGGSGASGTGDGGSMAATGRRALVRAGYGYETIALSEDEEWAEGEIARLTAEHPTVGLAMRDPRNYGTVVFDGPGVTPNVNKHYDFEVHDVGARDDGDPTDTQAAKEIARLLKEHGGTGLFGGGGAAYGANRRGRLAGPYPGTGPSDRPQNLVAASDNRAVFY